MSQRRKVAGLVAGAVIALLAATACSTSGDSAATGGAPAAPAGEQAGKDDFASDGSAGQPGGSTADGDASQTPARVRMAEQSLIYTGSISIRVENVVEAADRAVTIVSGLGGLVGADKRSLDAGRSEAQLTLRVPADKFTAALNDLARQLGEEESRAVQTEDVTEAMIDLDTRLATQRASVERVRALLARARTIGEVVAVEGELTRREAELASLEQRKERLADQVALSTITVNLRGPDAPGEPEDETGFVAGLKAGWDGFLRSVQAVLTVAGWLLPWLLAVGLPVWLLVWVLRRRGRPIVVAPVASTPDQPAP